MGYRGKVGERERARKLRTAGWTMPDIAEELGVSRSSVSLWTRDVVVEMGPRRVQSSATRPNRLRDARLAETEAMDAAGTARLGALDEQAFLAAGVALYAGEGAKRDGSVVFANSDPRMVEFFCAWLRRSFDVDEARLRVTLYLHEGLDLDAAEAHWSRLTGIPVHQFTKPYRAVPDATIRYNKHEHGCARVVYSLLAHPSRRHGLGAGTASFLGVFRGSSIGGAGDC